MLNSIDSYVIALYDLAKEQNQINLVYKQVNQIKKLAYKSNEFMSFINNLSIDKKDRKDFANDVFKQLKYHKLLTYWIWTIIDNDKNNDLVEICKAFERYCELNSNSLKVICYSAIELSSKQLDKISKFISHKLNKKINMVNEVNSKYIAGIKLQIGSQVYDGTVSGKLENLKNRILIDKLKEQ